MDVITELVETHAPIETAAVGEGSQEALAALNESVTMKIAYYVTGERRKELVKAISQFTKMVAKYQSAPTFDFTIGNYIVD